MTTDFSAILFISCKFFAFLSGHLLRDGYDVDATEVKAVGIETGIDGGIVGAMGAGVDAGLGSLRIMKYELMEKYKARPAKP